jgi:hypothetical protein
VEDFMLGFNQVRGLRTMVGKSPLELAKATRLPVEQIELFEEGSCALLFEERRAIESALVEAAVAMVRDPKGGILSGKLILLRR